MGYLAFLAAPHPTNPHEQAFAIIRRHADHQAAGNMSTLGWVKPKQEWTRTPSTKGLANEWAACQYIAEVSMGLTNVTAARIGNATTTVPACLEYASSAIVVWTRDNPGSTYFHYTGPGQILSMRQSFVLIGIRLAGFNSCLAVTKRHTLHIAKPRPIGRGRAMVSRR